MSFENEFGELCAQRVVGEADYGRIWLVGDITRAMLMFVTTSLAKAWDTGRAEVAIHISSSGGDGVSALGMVDAIRACPLPVTTHVHGWALSGAALVAVAGDYRLCGPSAVYLFHEAVWQPGKPLPPEDLRRAVGWCDNHSAAMFSLLEETTGLAGSDLTHDLWLNAREALARRVVDEILQPRDEKEDVTQE